MRVHKREWRWVGGYALLLAFFTLVPYLVGWANSGDDWAFNGFTFGVDDGNAYLGKMRIGAVGDWRFYLFYTPEAHEGVWGLYLPFILIGHLVGKPSADALAVAFQVWRVLACIGLILAMYRFISVFLSGVAARRLALVLASLGGGMGWILALFGGALPVDFYIPEGFSFLALYGLPHIATARAALLVGLLLLMAATEKNDLRLAFAAGVCWNIVGLMVTFYLAVLYALLAAWGGVLWLRGRRFPLRFACLAAAAVGLTLPLFLYSAWIFGGNDVFAQWSAQNYLPSPPPIHYVWGYAVWAGLAWGGGRLAWRRAKNALGAALLVAWVGVVPVLVYLPLNVQRRLSEGVIVPLAILAVWGLRLFALPKIRWVMVALLTSGAGIFWLATLLGLLNPGCSAAVCPYRPQAERAAMAWLQAYHGAESAVVLASFRTGNYLPIYTHLRPFVGHGPETLYSTEKTEQVRDFYADELPIADLTRHFPIQYVWYGTLERELGMVPDDPALVLIYDQDGYMIFEVVTP